MKHLHKASGITFDCGELIERDTGRTFNMTVITLWHETDECDCKSPDIIGYYFGEYDAATTDYYIDDWFDQQNKTEDLAMMLAEALEIIRAYHITNRDVLEIDDLVRIKRLMRSIDKHGRRLCDLYT